MPVTLTVKQLVDAAASGALARYFSIEKPVTVSWKNRKQVAACEEEHKRCDALRVELCKKHGRLDEKTKNYVFVGEGLAADAPFLFNADMTSLLAQEVQLPGEPVSVSLLAGKLTERDLFFLEPFLTD